MTDLAHQNEEVEVASSALRSRRARNIFSRGDSSPSALERFSAALASAAASVSHTFNPSSRSISIEAAASSRSRSTSPSTTRSPAAEEEAGAEDSCSPSVMSNTLQVPSSGYGQGAIPRRPQASLSREPSTETMACFCGHYSESVSGGQPQQRRGRCRLCRSRAKYVPGQRSFDASRLFGRGRRERGEPRRAISEDQRDTDELVQAGDGPTSASTSSLDEAPPPARRPWRLKPVVKRQARLELDVPTTMMTSTNVSPSRDHGLRTPPGPPMPSSSLIRVARPTRPEDDLVGSSSRQAATHVMASEMSGLLAPPSRTVALARAHTDPTSSASSDAALFEATPNSPPPSYEEVMKEPRAGPPSYEEALCSSVTSWRLSTVRSLSADDRFPTSHPTPPPPFRHGRASMSSPRPLLRSSRAEEIPDIYWEQAARELDFCTCRKCQARYRQYFEEDLDPNNDEAMIPMETQVLMQEVLTDGMAFCALM